MTDRYAVIGNPVAHSKSPLIHAAFARQTGEDLVYERLGAPLDAFAATVAQFAHEGGRGLNVTVPFKVEAFKLSQVASERACCAGACNTMKREGEGWYADNTDGAGLLRDLGANHQIEIAGRDVLILGAGGAARGILAPLLASRPGSVTISNRTASTADDLVRRFAARGPLAAIPPDALGKRAFDLVINATSAGLAGDTMLPWPTSIFRAGAFAYDMVYGDRPTLFLQWARAGGATRSADGLGMLIEQAAESFLLWRGVRPDTAPVYRLLRPAA